MSDLYGDVECGDFHDDDLCLHGDDDEHGHGGHRGGGGDEHDHGGLHGGDDEQDHDDLHGDGDGRMDGGGLYGAEKCGGGQKVGKWGCGDLDDGDGGVHGDDLCCGGLCGDADESWYCSPHGDGDCDDDPRHGLLADGGGAYKKMSGSDAEEFEIVTDVLSGS